MKESNTMNQKKEEKTNLTENEISQIRYLVDFKEKINRELGEVETQIITLKKRKESITELIHKSITLESELISELENKYGKGRVDLDSMSFFSDQREG